MESHSLSSFMESRKNNLDIIRFISASLVVFSHSFPLTNPKNNIDPLYSLTRQISFGGLAVATFFIISGFLIAQSFERSKSLISYFKSRVLRLFPGLLICLAFSAFVLGALFTTLSIRDYFTNNAVYKHFVGITLLPNLSPSLPGVFENNPYGSVINGSLWTLKYEFLCYIAIAVLGICKLLNKKFVIPLLVICLLSSIPFVNKHQRDLFMLTSYFFSGTLIYFFRNQIQLKRTYAVVSLLLIIIASPIGLLRPAITIFGAYIIIYLSYQRKVTFHNFAKFGDPSYGIYIYGFPVQQAVIHMIGPSITPFQNFIISFTNRNSISIYFLASY